MLLTAAAPAETAPAILEIGLVLLLAATASSSTRPISRIAGAVSAGAAAVSSIRVILSCDYEHHARSTRSRAVHRGGDCHRWPPGPRAHQRRSRRRRLLVSTGDGWRWRAGHESRAAVCDRVRSLLSERHDERRAPQEPLGGRRIIKKKNRNRPPQESVWSDRGARHQA